MELTEAKATSLGHLGLVASTLRDYGIMNKIDEQLGHSKDIKGSWI